MFSQAGRRSLVIESGTGWSTFAAPDGTVVDAIAVGDRIYVIVGDDPLATRLWTAQLK